MAAMAAMAMFQSGFEWQFAGDQGWCKYVLALEKFWFHAQVLLKTQSRVSMPQKNHDKNYESQVTVSKTFHTCLLWFYYAQNVESKDKQGHLVEKFMIFRKNRWWKVTLRDLATQDPAASRLLEAAKERGEETPSTKLWEVCGFRNKKNMEIVGEFLRVLHTKLFFQMSTSYCSARIRASQVLHKSLSKQVATRHTTMITLNDSRWWHHENTIIW